MNIYSAIDIIDGKAVRLTKGDYDACEILSDNPLKAAEGFFAEGARHLHVVDLDGAKDGAPTNYEIIAKIAALPDMFVEVGGGIRDSVRIEKYLRAGVSRVILGTVAVENFDFVIDSVKKYGDKIAVGIDCKNGFVATAGWMNLTAISGFDFAEKCRDAGVQTVIYTDIDTDGAMSGTNMKAFKRLSKIEGLKIIASGGISYEKELYALKKLGISGVILGKAIYHGLLNIKDSLRIAEDNNAG